MTDLLLFGFIFLLKFYICYWEKVFCCWLSKKVKKRYTFRAYIFGIQSKRTAKKGQRFSRPRQGEFG
jgi:hypothetical protein